MFCIANPLQRPMTVDRLPVEGKVVRVGEA